MGQKQTFADRCFKDRNGKLALTATPNLPLIIWALAALMSHLVSYGTAHTVLNLVALIAIVIWALLEILQGVNYFRRSLGLVVLAFTIYVHFFR